MGRALSSNDTDPQPRVERAFGPHGLICSAAGTPHLTSAGRRRQNKGILMLHELVLAAQSQPEAAGFILSGIKGIFVAIGSIIAAIVCGVIAAMKGRNPLGWGVLGLFFSILTLIVVIIVPSKK
jgi:hypothetical protein